MNTNNMNMNSEAMEVTATESVANRNSVFGLSRLGRTCNCNSGNCNCATQTVTFTPTIPLPSVTDEPPTKQVSMVICDNCEAEIPQTEIISFGWHYQVCRDCKDEVEICSYCSKLVNRENTRYDVDGDPVCEYCIENGTLSYCDGCGCLVPEEHIEYVECEESFVCRDCLDDNYYQCNRCNEYIPMEDAETDDYDMCLCRDCFQEGYFRCYDCDRIIDDDYAYSDNNENTYCEDCWNKLNIGLIHPYDYNPSPIFHRAASEKAEWSTRYFGVELEIDYGGENGQNAKQILISANSEDEDLIYCKHDSSLENGGFEIVSHPMTLNYHMNEMDWESVMQTAESLGYKSHDTDTCGLHVHVSKASCSNERVFGNCIIFIEKFYDKEICSITRRTAKKLKRWADCYDIYHDSTVNVNDPQSVFEYCDNENYNDRYKDLNFQNFDTVEFRIFRGTLKHDTFIATLQFVDSVIEFAEYVDNYNYNMNAMEWTDYCQFVKKNEKKYEKLITYLESKELFKTEQKIAKEKSDFIIEGDTLVKYVGNDTEVVIPMEVGIIGDYAFIDNESITKVTIPEHVVEIGEHAFEACTSLKEVVFTDKSKLVSMSSNAFSKCPDLKRIIIPEHIEHIVSECWGYNDLGKLVIKPDSVTENADITA